MHENLPFFVLMFACLTCFLVFPCCSDRKMSFNTSGTTTTTVTASATQVKCSFSLFLFISEFAFSCVSAFVEGLAAGFRFGRPRHASQRCRLYVPQVHQMRMRSCLMLTFTSFLCAETTGVVVWLLLLMCVAAVGPDEEVRPDIWDDKMDECFWHVRCFVCSWPRCGYQVTGSCSDRS